MVTKTRKQGGVKGKKGKIKVLNLKKEMVKRLSGNEARDIKGGISKLTGRSQNDSNWTVDADSRPI